MKKTITSLAIFSMFASFGQFENGINITSPVNGVEQATGTNLVVELEVSNDGSILPEFDTLFFGWVLDDVFLDTDIAILSGASVGGGGVTFPLATPKTFSGISDGSHTLCVWFLGIGSAIAGRNFDMSLVTNGQPLNGTTISDVTQDPSPLNNESCINFIIGDTTTTPTDTTNGGSNAITEHSQLSKLNVYPNPSNGQFSFEANQQAVYAQVVSLTGKIVREENIENKTTVDYSTLPQGIYLFRLMDSNNEFIKQQRIVIQ